MEKGKLRKSTNPGQRAFQIMGNVIAHGLYLSDQMLNTVKVGDLAPDFNLKNFNLDIPRDKLVVVTGLSGSGKSTLAFDTLYAEGQRRYVESFSAYARQFLERLSRPPVDELDPVPVGIAVDRQAPVRTSRSTLAKSAVAANWSAAMRWWRWAPSSPSSG